MRTKELFAMSSSLITKAVGHEEERGQNDRIVLRCRNPCGVSSIGASRRWLIVTALGLSGPKRHPPLRMEALLAAGRWGRQLAIAAGRSDRCSSSLGARRAFTLCRPYGQSLPRLHRGPCRFDGISDYDAHYGEDVLMKAAILTSYGPADVVRIDDGEKPTPRDNGVPVTASVHPFYTTRAAIAHRLLTDFRGPAGTSGENRGCGHVASGSGGDLEGRMGDQRGCSR